MIYEKEENEINVKPLYYFNSRIPDIPVDGASEDWVKRVSPQDLNEKPRVIGGHRSRGSSDSHGYNSQSESDGLPWVEPYHTVRSEDNASTVKLPRTFPETAWHPVSTDLYNIDELMKFYIVDSTSPTNVRLL